jgi:predicted oxidoreductase (fatty acid repression mutant protein)
MANDFFNAIKARRSIYSLGKDIDVSDGRIEEILGEALKHAPSPFNGQAGRMVLLLGAKHDEFWDATRETLRPLVPPEAFGRTDEKISSFKAGHGTVLFFEDQAVIEGFQKRFPLFKDNFPIWSGNATGMLQYVVWTGLAVEGVGASLQHYNPLVDAWVHERLDLPSSWKLTAEMPFGRILAPAGAKDFSPLEGRLSVLGR